MNFKIGDRVRQKSTNGIGIVMGINPALPPSIRMGHDVKFDTGPSYVVEAEDLEPFVGRRSGIPDRRRPVIVKYQGQCVIDSLAAILKRPQSELARMFEETFLGTPKRRDPSNCDHMFEVLIDYGFMVCHVGTRVDLKGKRRLAGLRRTDDPRDGHAVAILEDEKIIDSRHEFNDSNFGFQLLAYGWEVGWVIVIETLAHE
jgi:hypothetical protein